MSELTEYATGWVDDQEAVTEVVQHLPMRPKKYSCSMILMVMAASPGKSG